MNKIAYAHSLPDKPEKEWQLLDVHLKAVAEKAEDFGLSFAGNIWIESAQGEDYAFYRC